MRNRFFAPSMLFLYSLLPSLLAVAQAPIASTPDTLVPLKDGVVPEGFEEIWEGFDPQDEPLETETLHEWEEDGVVMRVVRFRIGVFKGTESKLAAIYGYPKLDAANGHKIPGLLQIHGGGQYADHRAVLTNAKRGYATLSIAWAGRISAPGYRVGPEGVKLFWDGKTNDPNYKLTTDWGAVDGYHAPTRNPGNNFLRTKPGEWTLDDVESPRNSPWFLCALAGRRALTFLERQLEVDADRLGVYGHSMGGKLTVMIAPDKRVKAAAPSCGGISDRDSENDLYCKTLNDDISLANITCPIIFLSPSNDFHGRIGDLPEAVNEIDSQDWRVTCSPHKSHRDSAEFAVATQLWFDQHLKGELEVPGTPQTSFLPAGGGSPVIQVQPDSSRPIRSVSVFYTQHGKANETPSDRVITTSRFWRHAEAIRDGDVWTASLPLSTVDQSLWVYANVEYELSQPITGAGYYYGLYTADKFNVSSLLQIVSPEKLKESNLKPMLVPSLMIEEFKTGWEKAWFTLEDGDWQVSTHKVYDACFKAPAGSKLAFGVRADKPGKLLIVVDGYAAEFLVNGDVAWQEIQLSAGDLRNFNNEPLASWAGIATLRISDQEWMRGSPRGQRRTVGDRWEGVPPQFRNLRWTDPEPEKIIPGNER